MLLEWDDAKAAANFAKHGIRFEEAATVLGDPFELTIPDPSHSMGERRFVSVGMSEKGRLLTVVYTERAKRIRIISCRRAARNERKTYEEEQD